MKDPLDKVLDEARRHLGTSEARDVDWKAVDRELFARIQEEQAVEQSRFAPVVGRGRWTRVVAATAAAAAVFGFMVLDGREHGRESSQRGGDSGGGRVVSLEGEGQMLIDGRPVARGATLRLGDVIEVRGGPVTVERPGKLTMRIEPGSRAAVTHTDGALVLALAEGAVEAQVVPVPNGEAFAVDIAGARVAVHGTHLRVARIGEHVDVDLNEGVVVVGHAPRAGMVVGSLVTAPAHAEFTAADLSGTLSVTHDGAAVRPPVALGPASPVATLAPPASPASPLPGATPPVVAPGVAPHPASAVVAHVDPRPSAAGATPAVAPVEATPEQVVTNAVRACMSERPHAENVTVVVRTTLHLDLADDGTVRAARFEPPVAPDVNGCASPAIYKARFAHGGSTSIEVDFSN